MEPVPEISVVLPAYNEAGNIAPMVAALTGCCSLSAATRWSSSMTARVTARSTPSAPRPKAMPQIRYVSFTRNFGHQAALRAGLRHARGRAVVVMDADFEHPPELLPELVAAWRKGAKIVVTRRDDGAAELPAMKNLTSRLYYRVLDAIGDVRIEPGSADYMLIDRNVVDVINGLADQDVFLRGAVRWFGFPLTTLTYLTRRPHLWRDQIFAAPHGRSCRHRDRRTQRTALAALRSGWRSALPRSDCCS